MGQKVNPIANRLGIIRGWDSNWFGGKDFSDKLVEDAKIRKYLNVRLAKASIRMEKLLKSAIANWEAKNESERLEDTKLCVKEVFVDCGRMLKRIQAAPQGRAHRIRKRSNHVTIVVDKMVTVENK